MNQESPEKNQDIEDQNSLAFISLSPSFLLTKL
jgi:hypothetical protein